MKIKYHRFDINNKIKNRFNREIRNEPFFCIKCLQCFDLCCKEYINKLMMNNHSSLDIVDYLNNLNIEGCKFSDEEWVIKNIIE